MALSSTMTFDEVPVFTFSEPEVDPLVLPDDDDIVAELDGKL